MRSGNLAALALLVAACASAGTKLVSLMPGVVNDPKNRTLRREILAFGSDQFCKELLKRGTPIKMSDDQPSIGAFYAQGCDYRELDGGDAFVQFGGVGYGWTEPSARVGFRASAAVDYNPDFLLDGSTMYAYFRPRSVQGAQFQSLMVERTQGTPLAILGPGVQDIANRLGTQILGQELSRGFTVIRDDSGTIDFGLGIIEKGKRPFHPYDVHGSDKVLLADDWTEVHPEQRAFLGPYEIDDDKRALYLTMSLDGIPAVDIFVLRKDVGDAWRDQYINVAGVGPLLGPPLLTDVLPTRTDWKRTVPLAKGLYYVVVDNTSQAGPVSPPSGPGGILGPADVAAVVRYAVQVGDAP